MGIILLAVMLPKCSSSTLVHATLDMYNYRYGFRNSVLVP